MQNYHVKEVCQLQISLRNPNSIRYITKLVRKMSCKL